MKIYFSGNAGQRFQDPFLKADDLFELPLYAPDLGMVDNTGLIGMLCNLVQVVAKSSNLIRHFPDLW